MPQHPDRRRSTGRSPSRRKAPGRRPRSRSRKRLPRGIPSLRSAAGDLRQLAGLVLVLLLIAVFPPTRRVVRGAWGVLREAMALSRSAEARRAQVVRYAARYGIPVELAGEIYDAADAEGLDPELGFRLVRVESEFNERAVSPVGALGLTQLMPATAAGMRPGITREEIFHRETNLRLGFRYMRSLLRHYDGNVPEALHAYNRGIGTVERIRAAGGDPANGYAAKVLGARGASPVRAGVRASDAGEGVPMHDMAPARLPAGF